MAYREFGLGLAFAAVAEEPVLWCHGSLRHVHGWSATTPDVGVALHKSLAGIGEGPEGLVTARSASYATVRYFFVYLLICFIKRHDTDKSSFTQTHTKKIK